MNGNTPTQRVIRITGSAQTWAVWVSRTDVLTATAQLSLVDGWLSMREYAVLEGQINTSIGDTDGRTDGEWLNAALFGKLTPKPKFNEKTRQLVEPQGLTLAQRLNLGWAGVAGLRVIGSYTHLPNLSPFVSYILTGGSGYPAIAPAGQTTIGQLRTQLSNDGRIAADDKWCLWGMFVLSALADGTIPQTYLPGLPVLSTNQIATFKTLRANYRVFGPIFNFVTATLGAGFPAP